MIINKTMDRDDLESPESKQIIEEIEDLMKQIREKGQRFSTWWGTFNPVPDQYHIRGEDYQPYPDAYDDTFNPWFKYWEIAWICRHSGILETKGRCLDMGGCSSIFSYYLAYLGNEVLALDLKPTLVKNGDRVADAFGWKLENMKMDMVKIDQLHERFDYIFSICVVEHLPLSIRHEVMSKVADRLNPGGVFALTFDYLNPHPRAKINSHKAIFDQFVYPSNLELMGNPSFIDNGKRYLSYKGKPYTFASLFLKKV